MRAVFLLLPLLALVAGCQTTEATKGGWRDADHTTSRVTVISKIFGVRSVKKYTGESGVDIEHVSLTHDGAVVGNILYQETSAYYSGFRAYNVNERLSSERISKYINLSGASGRDFPIKSKIINNERLDYVDVDGPSARCIPFITLMGGGGNALADGRILLSGGVCATLSSAIHGNLDAKLFELLRDLKTDGSGKSKVSRSAIQSSSKTRLRRGPDVLPLDTYKPKRLCNLALDREDTTRWSKSEVMEKYATEAKRRGFDIEKCHELVGMSDKVSCNLPTGYRWMDRSECLEAGGRDR